MNNSGKNLVSSKLYVSNQGTLQCISSITLPADSINLECVVPAKQVTIHDCINKKKSSIMLKYDKNIPSNVYVTDKATVFEYISKDDKIVLYRQKGDEMNLSSAFLWAYFLKSSGLSKTQMHKCMNKLDECIESVEVPNKKKK